MSEALTLATRVYNEKQGLKAYRRATNPSVGLDKSPLDLSWLQQPQLQRKKLRPLPPRRSQSLSAGTSDTIATDEQRLQQHRLQSLLHLRRRLETDLAARVTADRQGLAGVVATAAEQTHAAPIAAPEAEASPLLAAAAAAAAVVPVASPTVVVAPPTVKAAVIRAPRLADLAVRTPTADSAAHATAAFAAAADAAVAALAQLHRAQGKLHRKTAAAAAAAAGTAASTRTASKQHKSRAAAAQQQQQVARSTACAAMALENASSKQAARLHSALQCTADYTVYCDLALAYGPLSESEFTLTSTPGALYHAHCSSAASRVQAWWFRVWQPLRSKQLRAVLAIQAQVSSL
jgi:hypothetical protein